MEKEMNDISMFYKKNIKIQQLNEKLKEFKQINDLFDILEYKITKDKVKDKILNPATMSFFFISLIMSIYIMLNFKMPLWKGLTLFVFINTGFITFVRSTKFGILKNRYKKWKMLRNDIDNIMQNNDCMFSILLEVELELKYLQKKFANNQQVINIINNFSTHITRDIKDIFITYKNDENKSLIPLLKKFERIEKYKEDILKNIEEYQINNDYIEYKKAHGIVEEDNEKQLLDNKLIKNFKAIL